MIKAAELRIGNWVVDPFGRYRQISAIDAVDVSFFSKSARDGTYTSGIKPIELSPEILEKAGFVGWKRQVSLNMGYEGGDIFFGIPDGYDDFRGGTVKQPKYKHSFILDLVLGKKINEEDYEFTIYYGRGGSKKGLEIKSLHQLQNLYHALSGEELTITL